MGCLAGFLQETLGSYLGETTEHSLQERLGPGRVDGFLDQRFRNIKKGCLADFLQEIYSGERTAHSLQESLHPDGLVGTLDQRFWKNKTGCLVDCRTQQESLEGCVGAMHVDS
jgi:hypothetical protein